jgi:hypothetical protein
MLLMKESAIAMKTINKPLNKLTNSFYPSDVDMSEIKLPMIVVLKNPLDYPDKYVARLHEAMTNQATNVIMVKGTLEEIRAGIPTLYQKLMPSEKDVKNMVEYYI